MMFFITSSIVHMRCQPGVGLFYLACESCKVGETRRTGCACRCEEETKNIIIITIFAFFKKVRYSNACALKSKEPYISLGMKAA